MKSIQINVIRATKEHAGKECLHSQCKKKAIEKGNEICESPDFPGFFYHYFCYRAIWESRGKLLIDIAVPPPPAELN